MPYAASTHCTEVAACMRRQSIPATSYMPMSLTCCHFCCWLLIINECSSSAVIHTNLWRLVLYRFAAELCCALTINSRRSTSYHATLDQNAYSYCRITFRADRQCIMTLNSPGGSTMQHDAGRALLSLNCITIIIS